MRAAFSAADSAELAAKLAAFADQGEAGTLDGKSVSRVGSGTPRVAMVFPGQGSQWAGMGAKLYATEPVFRSVVDLVDAEWIKLAGCKLSEVAFDKNVGAKINECIWAQPTSFMLQASPVVFKHQLPTRTPPLAPMRLPLAGRAL